MTVIILILPSLLLSIIPTTLSDIYVYNNVNKLVEDYDEQPASFGPAFSSDGIKGYVAITSPKNACTKVAPPPSIAPSGYQWIALIPRTKSDDMCDFDLKVFNAQNANFSAVIIYNYEDSLITMNSHGRDVRIPSTLITHSDGLAIIKTYLYNETAANSTPQYHIKIMAEQIFRFAAYLIPFICILVKCYLHRRQTRRHRLPRSALKQLKIKKFTKGDRWEVCAICLDDFEEGAKLRILPCDHAYHMKCIDPWLLNNRRQCPVCKRYVFPNHDHSEEDESHDQATTERTPLIRPTEENLADLLSRIRQADRRTVNPAGADASNLTSAVNDSSHTDDDNDDDNASLLPRQSTTNHITTADLVFERPSSNSPRYSHSRLPRVIVRQSSVEENDNNTTTTTTYGSLHESSSTSFTTPRAANFFVGSLGGTTDNTNISARSVIEGESDMETDDNDERMHSVLTDVEVNEGYIPDEETINVLRTNL